MNNKSIGDIAESFIIAKLLKNGYTVLKPFGDNSRYDLVVEDSSGFHRVQCKSGKLGNGGIKFATCSSHYHTKKGSITKNYKKDYRGQIELFAVFCAENEKVYLISVDEVPLTSAVLRTDPPKNGQKSKIRMAKDYEI